MSDCSDRDSAAEEQLPKLEFVVPIKGVNWPVKVPVTISWVNFRSIIANELGVSADEIKLSYRFSSFAAAENSEVLCSREHFENMVTKAMGFLTGKRKVRGGREFRVHLDPGFKQPPTTASETAVSKKGKGKVSRVDISLHCDCNILVSQENRRRRRPVMKRRMARRRR